MNCSMSSSFVPSDLVTAFHGIPHVDINLEPSPSDFQISLEYFEAIIIWACVPILVVVCLFVLLSVYFIFVCCCCCFQQHDKRSTCSKATCGVLITLLVILCLCMVGVGLWAEFEWDRNLNQFVTTARDTNSLVDEIQSQAGSYESEAVSNNLSVLDNAGTSAGNALEILMYANLNLSIAFREISTKASLNADGLSTVLDVATLAEVGRHWSVFAYLIVLALVLVLLAGSLCCSAACSNPACTVITLFIFSFMTITAWMAVGGNLAYLVIAGDICHDPDNLIRNYTSNVPNATIPADVIDYYLVCDETCISSPFQESYADAITALNNISGVGDVVREYIEMNRPDLLPTVDGVQMAFNGAESAITNLTMLSNCTRINSDYVSILNSFCTDGYLFSLVLFGMICGLAVGMLVLVICTTFFAGLLSSGKEYDEETIVYDFPDEQNSPWESYGGGQNLTRGHSGHYSQFRGEEYNMRPSPPTDNPGPPKYTDLTTHTTSMDNGTGGDTTLDGRPSSGAYDHFTS